MKIILHPQRMQQLSRQWKARGESIGFVPTMGALHEGHASLIKQSVRQNDRTVVSIFVNPLQFGPQEDYARYPRTFKDDKRLCEKHGVDAIFFPSTNEYYPSGFDTYVEVQKLSRPLCGKSRPGHFKGVTTVVTKLFNSVLPDKAYFGQKDFQQAVIIRKMVHDLNFPITIRICPIIREHDGLALSSRNRYLSPEERRRALSLSLALYAAREAYRSGIRKSKILEEKVVKILKKSIITLDKIDYVKVVDAKTLEWHETLTQPAILAVAVKIGRTRLIDNIRLG
jgi:pantoate--beta-alanine ligase